VATTASRQRPWSDALWAGWLLFPFTFPIAFWFIGSRASDRYWTRLGWLYAIPVAAVVVAAAAGAGDNVGVSLLLVMLVAWMVALVQGFRALPRYRGIRRDGVSEGEEKPQQLSFVPQQEAARQPQRRPALGGRPLPFPPPSVSPQTAPPEQGRPTRQEKAARRKEEREQQRLASQEKAAQRKEERQQQRLAEQQERAVRAGAAERAETLAKSLRPSATLWAEVEELERALAEAQLKPRQASRMKMLALNAYCEDALADDILTVSEDRQLDQLLKRLDIELTRELTIRLVLAEVNDNRLPVASDVPIILRTNEKPHLCLGAGLIGDVTRTRYRGGSRGVSVPIGLGIRVRTGSYSGRAVSRTTAEVVDRGTLVVTSERVVFVGGKNTIEMALKKLVSLNAGSNEVQFHVSNRQKASTFRIDRKLTDVVAAVVARAAARVQ
jgi:hypothetical protein